MHLKTVGKSGLEQADMRYGQVIEKGAEAGTIIVGMIGRRSRVVVLVPSPGQREPGTVHVPI